MWMEAWCLLNGTVGFTARLIILCQHKHLLINSMEQTVNSTWVVLQNSTYLILPLRRKSARGPTCNTLSVKTTKTCFSTYNTQRSMELHFYCWPQMSLFLLPWQGDVTIPIESGPQWFASSAAHPGSCIWELQCRVIAKPEAFIQASWNIPFWVLKLTRYYPARETSEFSYLPTI